MDNKIKFIDPNDLSLLSQSYIERTKNSNNPIHKDNEEM